MVELRAMLHRHNPCHPIPRDVSSSCRYIWIISTWSLQSGEWQISVCHGTFGLENTYEDKYVMSSSSARAILSTNQYGQACVHRFTVPANGLCLRQYYDYGGKGNGREIPCFTGYPTIWINLTGYPTLCLFRMRTRLARLRFCIHVIV